MGPDERARSPAHLRARIVRAWAARHSSPDHRTVLGSILPDQLRDAQHLARATQGQQRRAANAILSEAYNLSQLYLAYQPAPDLLWRVAERGMLAAQESEDPAAIAGAAWHNGGNSDRYTGQGSGISVTIMKGGRLYQAAGSFRGCCPQEAGCGRVVHRE
jgi:hypothetical protein